MSEDKAGTIVPGTQIVPRLIVGLGASAGGLRALEEFFRAMPVDSGCSFIVVQHLSPDFRSLMDDLLARQTTMRIHQAEESLEIEPNTIYLIPAKKFLTLVGGRLHLEDRLGERAGELPINVFFQALAEECGNRSVGVVLSGTGSDGTVGVRAIHAAGGLVIVQDPATAEFDGMPTSALATGMVDYILAPAGMPEVILAYDDKNPSMRLKSEGESLLSSAESAGGVEGEYGAILRLLKRSTGLDFSFYKISTVERRIQRRALLSGHPTMPAYLHCLESTPHELDLLYHDLLIGVTEFFRDAEAFAALRTTVYLPLLSAPSAADIRVWVAGCATGEEAYSHAILLDELAHEYGFTGRISVFATDTHRRSLEVAAAGIYRADRLAGVSPERRDRYFLPDRDGSYRVTPELRQRVVFAPHDLLSDPPFTRMNAASCRNLLIYLTAPAQERVISLLHYSLRRGGAMFLGQSEGVGRLAGDFEVLDSKQKIFRKCRESRIPPDLRSPVTGRSPLPRQSAAPVGGALANVALPRGLLHAYDMVLARHLPPGFIISAEGEILHFIGDAVRYLMPQAGRASDNLLVRTAGELRLAVSTLIPKALRREGPARSRNVKASVAENGTVTVEVQIEVLPEDRAGVSLLHVMLRPETAPVERAVEEPGAPLPSVASPGKKGDDFSMGAAQARRIVDLEQDLLSTKENLQATVEELQTTNEELQAANEEMLAANEELQSTNEELHSVNEELYTVNSEFERKNVELNQTVADFENLLTATDAGTLFLDRQMRIRRFNPAIQSIFNLIPQDVGRSIEHIAYHLTNQRQMVDDIRRVLETGQMVEREVRTNTGNWLLKRTLPFRGAQKSIEGVVLTFTRTDVVKEMQAKLDLAMVSSQLVWWDWDLKQDVLTTHAAGWCILGYETDGLVPSSATWFSLVHPDDLQRVKCSLDECVAGRTAEWEAEHRFKASDGTWLWVINKGRVTERNVTGQAERMLGTTQNIHARKTAEKELVRLREAIRQTDASILITDADGRIEFVNPAFCRVAGYSAEEVMGQNPRFLKSDRMPRETYTNLWETLQKGEVWRGEFENRRKNGNLFWERASISPVRDENGRIAYFVAVKDDITHAREEQQRRQRLEQQLLQAQKMETLGTLTGGIAHDFNNLLTGVLGYSRMALASLPANHDSARSIEEVIRTSQRAAQLVRRMLAFSRQQVPNRSVINPGTLIEGLLPMLRSSLPSTIELGFRNEAPDLAILIEPSHFEQVIVNLCTNSGQAISQRIGAIQIDLSAVTLETSRMTVTGELPPGSYARIIVGDTGQGIDPAVIDRVFEPFFTARAPGEGTGLGLSIVHTTVATAGGGILLTSRRGKGTEVTLFFPLVGKKTAPAPATEVPLSANPPATPLANPPATPPAIPPGELLRGMRIFVVDDEDYVAAPVAYALQRAGATVETFNSGSDCLAAFDARSGAVNAVVTDQTMPGMTGLELVRSLRRKSDRMPAIIMSGFDRRLDEQALAGIAPCAFLAKPFGVDALLTELVKMLRP